MIHDLLVPKALYSNKPMPRNFTPTAHNLPQAIPTKYLNVFPRFHPQLFKRTYLEYIFLVTFASIIVNTRIL